MKNILFVLLICFPFQKILSQENTSTSGEASVNLIVPLSIKSSIGDLDFGEIILTGLPIVETILPRNGKKFVITGQLGRIVTIIFNDVVLDNSQSSLNLNGTFGELFFQPTIITSDRVAISNGRSIFLKPDGLIGKIELLVGGSINIDEDQPIGDYEGLFTLSVAY